MGRGGRCSLPRFPGLHCARVCLLPSGLERFPCLHCARVCPLPLHRWPHPSGPQGISGLRCARLCPSVLAHKGFMTFVAPGFALSGRPGQFHRISDSSQKGVQMGARTATITKTTSTTLAGTLPQLQTHRHNCRPNYRRNSLKVGTHPL